MIRIASFSATAILLSIGLAGSAAVEPVNSPLQGGSYEITYRLELPHLERWAVDKQKTICISKMQEPVLPVLSPNTPFAKCRTENWQQDGADLTYEIVCEGRASARAHAVYHFAPGEFQGRIAMVMGAKNMTMTEVQSGRRAGSCDLASAARE
jgi:Protein of unknown function (DUF3617)